MKKRPDNTDRWIAEYRKLQPLYQRLVDEVRFILEQRSTDPKVKVVSIHGRLKKPDSLREKIERQNYANPLVEITDLAGVRVVCNYEPDLAVIGEFVRQKFAVHEKIDKSRALGVERMGYHGSHYVVSLGPKYSGARYDGITELKSEIQVRTVLQNAWALISHHLVYKDEATIPERLRRDLNNVSSLLEIAQGVFDSIREKRDVYVEEIERKEAEPPDFLSQPVDFDTLQAYTRWKFPDLPFSVRWHLRLLHDLDLTKYSTLSDIDAVVEAAKPAIDHYRQENPGWFLAGTDFITKSLGFVDLDFRRNHPWGEKTLVAFERLKGLVKAVR
jgi:GTP pyrophosphokinase